MAVNLGNIRWFGDEVERRIEKVMSYRLQVASEELMQRMQDKVSRHGTSPDTRSRPGESPKIDNGERRDKRAPGALRGSMFTRRVGKLRQVIGSTDPVAKWQELGTGLYHHAPDPSGTGRRPIPRSRGRIRPRNPGSRLAWLDYGEFRQASSTKGIKRRPFMVPSLYEMAPRIREILTAPIRFGGRR